MCVKKIRKIIQKTFGGMEIFTYLCTRKELWRMTRIDLYLERPINILGEGGTSYPNTIHICTTTSGDEYIEDTDGDILYLHEMDAIMVANVQSIVEQNS